MNKIIKGYRDFDQFKTYKIDCISNNNQRNLAFETLTNIKKAVNNKIKNISMNNGNVDFLYIFKWTDDIYNLSSAEKKLKIKDFRFLIKCTILNIINNTDR